MSGHNQLYQEMGSDHIALADPGASKKIKPGVDRAVVELVSAAVETRDLMPPEFAGQELTIFFKTDGGNITMTAVESDGSTAEQVNVTENTTMVFSTAGQILVLRGVLQGSTYQWRIIANDGVTLSTP
jgi:hypothetical protein